MTIRLLTCQNPECGKEFRYVQHRSPNYPKFCVDCAKSKFKSAQSLYDERRRKVDLREAPKRLLDSIPDIGPKDALRMIDALKRLC